MESRLLRAIHEHASPGRDVAFVFSNDLGMLYFWAALVLALMLWHLRRDERREAALWVVLGLSTYAIQEGLKILVGRPRPFLWPRLLFVDSASFPSGHALASATFFPLLALDLTRGQSRTRRAWALGAAALLSLFIGFGRLYLGVHWPSDVVGGWALGVAQVAVAGRWLRSRAGNGRLRLRSGPVESSRA